MIEHGQADAIVVWRWSRVSRNRLDWAVAVDRVEAAGGALESATEAARIAGVKVHTVRSWDVAGHLPHTQMAPDGATRRYAIQDLRKMRPRYKTNGVWVTF